MIRMTPSISPDQAKDYYTSSLSKNDYYMDDQELGGSEFRGKLAARLGITGQVSRERFFALCENRHPLTHLPLTPRTRTHRRVGYDLTFDCPKSVSIIHALSKDDHILHAFQIAVKQTMTDIEAEMHTRVRKGKQDIDRKTGELLWADFIHQTARPIDGAEPDPHLHCHCYVLNTTWDATERRFKAGQFGNINKKMPYYQALFHKRLSDKLIELGYDIRATKTAFEINGVPQKVIDLFSKRKGVIDTVAKEKGITDAKKLAALGARTRAKKQKGLTMAELKVSWRKQIHDFSMVNRMDARVPVRFGPAKHIEKADPKRCVDYAVKHHFERSSVVTHEQLLMTAINHSIGMGQIGISEIENALKSDKRILQVNLPDGLFCTTKEVLTEEKRMIELAKAGVGAVQPLYASVPDIVAEGQQKAAIEHILTINSRISIIRGAAGTGKTTMTKEAVEWIEKAGKEVTILAPTAQASRNVLRSEGFEKAETLALFLSDPKLQKAVKGQVILLDEAGLAGTQDMSKLLQIATDQDARIILLGDTRQHASVVRGDALRILNTVGGIPVAEVNKIYRQTSKDYRDAVALLADGHVKTGFEKLDSMGFIKTIDKNNPDEIATDYLKILQGGKTGLVISPTHNHGDKITASIRAKMREAGMLGDRTASVDKLRNLNLTEAEKTDARNYPQGGFIQFNQNAPGFKRGSLWTVQTIEQDKVIISEKNGRTSFLPKGKEKHFDVFEMSNIEVSVGDKLRITRTCSDKDGQRLNNGQVFIVKKLGKDGSISLANEISKYQYEIASTINHIDHAHCLTSYAAQGRTADEVIISQPAETFGATDARQFYVSVSRGRQKATIYTDDKAALLYNASQMGDRSSAMELMNTKEHLEHILMNEREKEMDIDIQPEVHKEDMYEIEREKDWDYGPGF